MGQVECEISPLVSYCGEVSVFMTMSMLLFVSHCGYYLSFPVGHMTATRVVTRTVKLAVYANRVTVLIECVIGWLLVL